MLNSCAAYYNGNHVAFGNQDSLMKVNEKTTFICNQIFKKNSDAKLLNDGVIHFKKKDFIKYCYK